jgi:hypothetical protein
VPYQFGCKGTTNILNIQRFFYEFIELNEFFFSLPLMPFMPMQILIQADNSMSARLSVLNL